MAAGLLFVSQVMLDSWAEQGKIDLVGNVMVLLAGEGGRRYALEPAVLFVKIVGGEGADPGGLVRKVKSVSQVRQMGGEIVGDSCIVGEVAYEVQPGFLAEAAALQAAAVAPPSRAARGAAPAPGAADRQARVRAPATSPAPGAAGEAPRRPLGGAPLPRDLEDKRKEAEALARFLLENLS